MEELLSRLGLNEKESKFYLLLVHAGWLTAAEIAKKTGESRTNAYMVLDKLIADNLVEVSEASAVRRYGAADPIHLRSRLGQQQQQLKQTQAALAAALPQLASTYKLGQHRPGVVYFEGLAGLKALLEDNAKTTSGTIDLIASNEALSNKEAWAMLQKGIAKRAAKGIATRGLFHVREDKKPVIKRFATSRYEIRFWGNQPLPGEIVIYGHKIAFTVYQPSLIVVIMTNQVLAETFRVIFEQLWAHAVPTAKNVTAGS